MGGRDLVVPVRADEQEVPHIALDHQVLEQVKRRDIEPLQIVQEQGERMLGPSEDSEKPSEHELEAALRVLWRQFRDHGLVADDDLQVGDEIHHELAVRSERLMERLSPATQFVVAFGQERTDQALKGLREGRVRNVAFVLVELARRKQGARRNECLVQLVHDGRFADPGIARDEHELGRTAVDDAIERGKQGLDVACPSVQLLRDQQPVGYVMFAERKVVDASFGVPLGRGSGEDRVPGRLLSGSDPRPSSPAVS